MEDLREKCSKERENSLQRPEGEKKLIVFKEQPVWLENKKEPCKIKIWGGQAIQSFEGDDGGLYIILKELGSSIEGLEVQV